LGPSRGRLETKSRAYYLRHQAQAWKDGEADLPWGHPDLLPASARKRYAAMGRLVEAVAPRSGAAFLDISAGNATLSLPLVSRFEVALLADVSAGAAAWLGRQNAGLVVRADYLRPPYAEGAFDFILCTDTLIYGAAHEGRLLDNLWRTLKPGGTALLNFHHRRHHLPIKPAHLVGYSRPEIETLLERHAPGCAATFHAYYQEFAGNLAGGTAWERAVRLVLPATRFFVEARKASQP
jgi:SAM-dependent methyltransferase